MLADAEFAVRPEAVLDAGREDVCALPTSPHTTV